MAVHLRRDDNEIAALDHRVDLPRMATADVTSMKFDFNTKPSSTGEDVGLVPL